MGMTITEKIMARKAGRDKVSPGEILMCNVDYAAVDEQIRIFEQAFTKIAQKVWDPERVIVVADHYVPPSSIDQAETVALMKKWAERFGITNVYLSYGIKHPLFREKGFALPGMLLVASDSHTNTGGAMGALAIATGPTDIAAVCKTGQIWLKVPPTIRFEMEGKLGPMVLAKDIVLMVLGKHGAEVGRYKAIEWAGSTIRRMSLDERMTLCNMTTEMGAKNGIVEPDDVTIEYAKRTGKPFEVFRSDPDASYEAVYKYDVSNLEPMVAVPYSPDNVVPISEVVGTKIDQAFVGTCTNAYLEHLELAAEIIRGKKVHKNVRFIVTPASRQIYAQAGQEGLLNDFMEAGAIVTNANCGLCGGMHMGILASEEVMISSQNRNFIGRNGPNSAKVYLANPAVVAASAIEGEITDPRKFLR